MPKTKPLRFALLVDADNVGLRAVDGALPAIGRLGTIDVCRVYGRLNKATRPGWAAAMAARGFPPPQIVYRAGRNAADFALSMDAVDLLHKGGIDAFCLMSSDGDFVHVVRWLRAGGMKVHVFGRQQASRSLKKAADRFHDVATCAAPSPVQGEGLRLQ